MSDASAATVPACPVLFAWPIRIYWEDTDAGGVVFYANYLKFFERARTEWLREWGPSQEALRASGMGMFVVSETQVRYVQPAVLDDELRITVELVEVGRATLVVHQKALRDTTLLCEGSIRIGWVQKTAAGGLKPARMPPEITNRLEALMPTYPADASGVAQ